MTTAAAEPPVAVATRFSLDVGKGLVRRQAAWVGAQVGVAALLAATAVTASVPELAVLPLAVGAAASVPQRWIHGVGLTAAAFATALLVGVAMDGPTTLSSVLSAAPSHAAPVLHGAQTFAAAAVVGAGLPWLDGGPPETWRSANGALAVAAAAGLGGWASAQLVPGGWIPLAAAVVGALVVGLVASQSLTVLALRHYASDRIPDRETIARSLGESHRGPALTAWQLDQELTEVCPDLDTRDGLGEVAAWIYRLQYTRQQLERERDRVGGPEVEERIIAMSEQAERAEDEFTRDRLLATVDHLERLRGHRTALEAEIDRAAALSSYATAFLEEARAELTLARVQPGDASPDRLPDVLSRLRTYSADQTLARKTRREVAQAVQSMPT